MDTWGNIFPPGYKFPSAREEIFVRTDVFFRRLFAGGGDALYEGGMDEGGGDGHEAGDADYQAAVAAETEEFALGAFEDAARDTHAVAFLKGHFGQGEIEQLFVLRTGHGYEVAHFTLRHGERLCRLAVHIETHRHAALQLLLERVNALAGGVGKDQIVHHGEEALDALPAAVWHNHLLHGQEIADALCVKVLLELELAAVRDTQDIPLFFCPGGKRRHSLQKVVFGGHRSLIFREYPTFYLIGQRAKKMPRASTALSCLRTALRNTGQRYGLFRILATVIHRFLHRAIRILHSQSQSKRSETTPYGTVLAPLSLS